MSSPPHTKTRHSSGRLIKRITWIIFPAGLVPAVLLGLLVYWYWQTWYYQPYESFLQYAAVLLGAALLLAWLVSWLAAQRMSIPLEKLAEAMAKFASGDWDRRAAVRQKDPLGVLATLFNQIADDYHATYQSLTLRDHAARNGRDQTLEQISSLVVFAHTQGDLLQGSLEAIARSFSCAYAAVYLLEQDELREKRFLNLAHSHKLAGFDSSTLRRDLQEGQVNLDAIATLDWLVSRAVATGEAQIQQASGEKGVVEAAVPLMRGSRVVGALDLFAYSHSLDARLGPFSPRSLSELQRAAGLIALAVENFSRERAVAEGTGVPETIGGDSAREQALLLYQASNWITQAETEEGALSAASRALEQSPYPSAILLGPSQGGSGPLRVVYRSDRSRTLLKEPEPLPLSASSITPYFNHYTPVLVANLRVNGLQPADAQAPERPSGSLFSSGGGAQDLPRPLLDLAREMDCDAAAFLPVLRGGLVSALLVLGRPAGTDPSRPLAPMPVSMLGPYQNLIELLVNSLENNRVATHTRRQLAELRTFWNVSQALSIETDLNPLFRTIHHQLESVMGELGSFAIALYDNREGTIRIPYMYEEGHLLDVAPFPLGEGLTSILIRTRQPLLLADNVEEQSQALGAKVQGMPAMSWLGVPMLYSGEAIGAIIVQDVYNAGRFNEDDQRLLSALASEVAVVVRNARLLEGTRQQAQQEHLINEITAKIRRSSDIQAILKTTAIELGSALNVRKAHIRLGLDPEQLSAGDGEGGK